MIFLIQKKGFTFFILYLVHNDKKEKRKNENEKSKEFMEEREGKRKGTFILIMFTL